MREDRGVVVANPPSAEQPFLRTSLLPNLLAAAARNADRGSRSVALFEVGHVFRLDDPVDERELVAIVMAGPVGEGLHGERREFDVLDAKGVLGVLLDGLGIGSWALGTNAGSPFHPGRSAGVEVGAAAVGVVGEVAPRIATARGIASRIAVFELDVDALEGSRTRGFRSRDIPRFPPVRRDLAFELPHETPAGDVHAAIVDAGGEFLSRVELFDVFVGPPLLPGTRSLAFAVEIRSPDRTLTDAEADAVVDRIVARVTTELGGSLRSG